MSQKSKVWNRGSEDYKEMYKNIVYTIPAGECIVMDKYDAWAFKGMYPGKGVVKQIQVEDIADVKRIRETEVYVCNKCGKEFPNERNLNSHIVRAHKEEDKEKIQDQESIEESEKS